MYMGMHACHCVFLVMPWKGPFKQQGEEAAGTRQRHHGASLVAERRYGACLAL